MDEPPGEDDGSPDPDTAKALARLELIERACLLIVNVAFSVLLLIGPMLDSDFLARVIMAATAFNALTAKRG